MTRSEYSGRFVAWNGNQFPILGCNRGTYVIAIWHRRVCVSQEFVDKYLVRP